MLWGSLGTYLRTAGPLLLPLLILSQLTKHSLMLATDYWLAHWTSQAVTARADGAERNCTSAQVKMINVCYGFLSSR